MLALEAELAADERVAHLAFQLVAVERTALAAGAQRCPDRRSSWRADRRPRCRPWRRASGVPVSSPRMRALLGRDLRQRVDEVDLGGHGPLEHQRQQRLEARGAGRGLAERQQLVVDCRSAHGPSRSRRSCRRPIRRRSHRGRAGRAAADRGGSSGRSSRCRRRSGAHGGSRRRRSPAGRCAWPGARARCPAADERRHRWMRAPVARCSSKIVCSATVSATTGIEGRPSRAATGPAAATPVPASVSSTGRSHSGRSNVRA